MVSARTPLPRENTAGSVGPEVRRVLFSSVDVALIWARKAMRTDTPSRNAPCPSRRAADDVGVLARAALCARAGAPREEQAEVGGCVLGVWHIALLRAMLRLLMLPFAD